MAILNFPPNPATNDTYSFGGKTWTYNGTAWKLNSTALTTTAVTEGTNLYFTNARSRAAISVSGSGSYDQNTGVITVTGGVTSVNGQTGAATGFATTANSLSQFASTTSSELATLISDETGTGNLVFSVSPALTGTPTAPTAANNVSTTQIATTEFVRNAVANLVDGAPALLDTLNELAAAINDDASFSATIANTISTAQTTANNAFGQANTATLAASSAFGQANTATLASAAGYAQANTATLAASAAFNSANTKVATVAGVTSTTISNAQLASGISSSGILTTANVSELTNQYFTNARARGAISVSGAGSYDSGTGVITITGGVTSVGGATGAVSNAQLASGITTSGVLNTSNVAEGANLYFTTSRARASIDAAAGGPITYNATTGNVALSASGVTATTYGSASKIPVITVDTYGRITTAANVSVAGVSNFTASGNTFTISTADGGSYSASIQPDSVQLGRDTTGNYVATLTAGTGIGITNNSGEGATPTVTNIGVTSVNGANGAITAIATTTGNLSQFASTTSADLKGVISDETGSGALVFANSPTLVSPILGTPQSATLTNATGLPIDTGVSGLGTGVATFLSGPTSANLRSAVSDETGSGSLVFSDSPVLITPNIGTPSYSVLTNATGLPVSTGISGLGAGVATFLATPTSANLATAVTDETGTGTLLFSNSPVMVTPNIGTPSYAILTNATGLPLSTGISGLGTGQTTLLGSAAATGVTANTYGGSSRVPVFTVDQYGRITSASNVAAAGGVSSFTASGNTFTIVTADNTFNASIQPDSVQLGRDTTGAYVGNLTAGTGVTLTNLAGENATPTIAIGQAVGTSADVSFNTVTTTANVNVGGALNVTGNLNVQGTTTTFNSTVVEVADSIIYLATGNSGDVQDIGIAGHFTGGGGYQHTGFVRDASDGEWKLFANVATEPTNNTLDFTSATYSPIRTGAITASSSTISGNISAGNAVVTSALTAGTLQTTGNVNANNLRVATNSSLGTVVSGTWNGSSISTAYTDAKVTSVNGQTGAATGFATTANSLSQFASTTSAQLATLISDETGSGALVFGTSPVLLTPNIGTPSTAILTNATGLPVSTGISGLGTGVATFLASPTSTNLASAVTDESGTGTLLFSNSPVMVTPNIGAPSYAVLTNATGLPVSSGISGLGANVATFLADPTSAKLAFAVTDETGSGNVVFNNSPTLVTPILGTPQSVTLTNATGLPVSTGISGLGAGVATFLANPTSANLAGTVTDESGTGTLLFSNSPIMVTPNIGTPSYAVLTNATGLPVSTGISGLGANQTTLLAANAQTGVTATTYGSALNIPVITVDVYGRITSASNVALVSGVSSVGGATGAVSNAQLASAITSSGVLTTANVSEVTNLYFTNARSRASVSAGTGISYDNSTGVISSTITQYTDTNARGAISLASGNVYGKGSYNNSTGVLQISAANVSVSATAPTNPNVGDTWIDNATGSQYLWINQSGSSFFWVEQGGGTTISSLVESVGGSTGAISNVMLASALTGQTLNVANLTVTGTLTSIQSTNLDITDKNITLAKGAGSSAGADGAGITIDGANATLNYVHATTAFTSSQDIDLASGKVYKINGTSVLSNTTLGSSVVNSSLTSVGTLGSLTVTNNVSAGAFVTAGNSTAANFQTTGNVNAAGILTTGSSTAGTFQTTGNVNANNLRVTTASSLGTVQSGVWQGTAIATTYGGTGNSTGYASGGAASAATATVTDDTATNATYYPMLGQATSGNTAPKVSSTKLTFNPSSGLLTSTDYNSSSDKRLKKNIKTVTSALDTVDALRGVSFEWKEGGGKAIGMIAQEVQEVIPEVVTTDDNGYMGIKYTNVIGVLVEAIKELKADFEAYKKTHP